MIAAHPPVVLDAKTTLKIPLCGVKLIEASAGTGKTYTIANLYLRHIFEGRSPSEILVVTFTNSATEELRGRIRARIYDALKLLNHPAPTDDEYLSLMLQQWQAFDPSTQQQHHTRLNVALRCMDEASIFTIHGFCQRALSDHALSTGQPFEASLLNDDSSLWDEALKDWWRKHSYTLGSEDWHLFQSCLIDLPTLLELQKIIRTGHQSTILPVVDEDLAALYQSWRLLGDDLKQLSAEWQTQKHLVIETLQASKALKRRKNLPYHKDNLTEFFKQWDNYFASEQRLIVPASLRYLCSKTLVAESTDTKRGTDPDLETGFFLLTQQVFNRIDQLKARFRVRALVEASEFSQQRVRLVKLENSCIAYQDQLNLLLEALHGTDGEVLAGKLRERFPVAMIDEFQDTDAIQYGIFKALYFTREDISLTMIGDPKQAIYSFRGGDIFTYMKARQASSVRHYSLLTNWRSEHRLVNAVNSLFKNRPAAFIYAQSIDYAVVQGAANKVKAPLRVDNSDVKPLTIWKIPQEQNHKNLGSEQAYALLNEAVVDEIARLILGGKQSSITLGTKPLRSGDIAILVRTAKEGDNLRTVLAARGIRAVTIGKDRVFDSAEAIGLYDLLLAICHHADHGLLRAALASELLGLNYFEINEICDNEDSWQDWNQKIHRLHLLWLHKGFTAMFQQLLPRLEIAERIATSGFAERRLTNLLHLAELAQQQSSISPGIDALLTWYRAQISQPALDDTELRLENDEELVKIVTIHKSKGLEYPVVFAPYLWTCRPQPVNSDSILRFHDQNHDPMIDLGSSEHKKHAFIAEKERLAEDIRLAYVAITRARAKVYLAWGDVGDGKMKGRPTKTALGYLLHPGQSASDLDNSFPRAFDNAEVIDRDLKTLVIASQGQIEVSPLPSQVIRSKASLTQSRGTPVMAATFAGRRQIDWHIASFTSLTRNIHQVAHGGRGGVSGDPILDFPAGSHVGLLLHTVLEHLDFKGDIITQCKKLLPRYALRYGLESANHQKTLSKWLETLVNCPLNESGLTLSSLSCQQRINELAFDFAIDNLSADKLNALLAQISGSELTSIDVESFQGMITGVIDLVFEYQGKYYLADYKSNFLGASLGDYSRNNLNRAILDRRYDLQYLLYSIALHRYLSQRLPDYQYEQHFGGVYYLFLRAMRPQSGVQSGVYFNLPAYADIKALDALMATKPGDIYHQ